MPFSPACQAVVRRLSLRFPPAARQMLFDVFAHSFFNPEEQYSAAELLAGCLSAHGRAVLAGESTYGKGAAAAWVPGPAGLSLRGARVRLPDGREISGEGLSPDSV